MSVALLRGQTCGLAPLATRGDLLPHDLEQCRVSPRLLDKIDAAALHGFHSNADCGPAGHDDDGRSAIDFFQMGEQVETLAAGSGIARVIQVHEEKVEFSLAYGVQQSRR